MNSDTLYIISMKQMCIRILKSIIITIKQDHKKNLSIICFFQSFQGGTVFYISMYITPLQPVLKVFTKIIYSISREYIAVNFFLVRIGHMFDFIKR